MAKVREILDVLAITLILKTPDFMRGVINLRGSVVPVMDMLLKFGMPPHGTNRQHLYKWNGNYERTA